MNSSNPWPIPVDVCKPKYGSIRNRGCIPSVPLRISCVPLEKGVKEGCSYSYDLDTVAGLYEKKEKLEIHDWNNNDLQVGLKPIGFPCVDGETAGGVKHLNLLSGFQSFLLSIVTNFIPGWIGNFQRYWRNRK